MTNREPSYAKKLYIRAVQFVYATGLTPQDALSECGEMANEWADEFGFTRCDFACAVRALSGDAK